MRTGAGAILRKLGVGAGAWGGSGNDGGGAATRAAAGGDLGGGTALPAWAAVAVHICGSAGGASSSGRCGLPTFSNSSEMDLGDAGGGGGGMNAGGGGEAVIGDASRRSGGSLAGRVGR